MFVCLLLSEGKQVALNDAYFNTVEKVERLYNREWEKLLLLEFGILCVWVLVCACVYKGCS